MDIESIISEVTDQALAFGDLRADMSYKYIPCEKRSYYINMGMQIGNNAAQQYANADLQAILKGDGVVINRQPKPSPIGLHSQILYDDKTKQIDLFSNTAFKIEAAMKKTPWHITAQQAMQMFIAHEFYHWLEYSSGMFAHRQCECVETTVPRVFRKKMFIRSVDEIAAFTFTNRLCKPPVHPKLIDYILAYDLAEGSLQQGLKAINQLQADYMKACTE